MSAVDLLLLAIVCGGLGWACLAIGSGPRMRAQGIAGAILVSFAFWLALGACATWGLA